jgi:hypothetical protein
MFAAVRLVVKVEASADTLTADGAVDDGAVLDGSTPPSSPPLVLNAVPSGPIGVMLVCMGRAS